MVRAEWVQLLAGCCLRDARAKHASLGAPLPQQVARRAVSGRPELPSARAPGIPGCRLGAWMRCGLRVSVHPRPPAGEFRPGAKESREGGPEGCSRGPQAKMLRERWRQGLAGRANLLSPRTPGSMKTPVELAISGMQTLHLQHRCRGGYRVKAKASYVDETLFGSPAGTKPPPPDFDPPWVQKPDRTRGVGTRASPLQAPLSKGSGETTPSRGSTPTLTPKKKNKYRLISRSPSYCDESLFGSRPAGTGWDASGMAKGDAAKLRALFWTPPATPRGGPSPRPREAPLRAVHPAGPSEKGPQAAGDACPLPAGGAGAPHPPGRGRSLSLTHLSTPSTGCPARTNDPQAPRPSTSGVTFRSPLVTPRARSVSASVPATPRQGGATPKPKPPWK